MQTQQSGRRAGRRFPSTKSARLREAHVDYHRTRDARLRQSLLEAYQPLAFALAARYARQREERDDINQCALLALVNAIDRFDPDRGVGFTTFAWATISGALKRHYRDNTWSVKVSRRLQELFLTTTRTIDDLTLELGRSPTITQIAERIGCREKDVLDAFQVTGAFSPASLDHEMSDERVLAQTLSGREHGFDAVEDRAALAPLVSRLPPREQLILHLRYSEEMTQLQIGREVGLGQMQVSRVLAQSLARLRGWMEEAQPA